MTNKMRIILVLSLSIVVAIGGSILVGEVVERNQGKLVSYDSTMSDQSVGTTNNTVKLTGGSIITASLAGVRNKTDFNEQSIEQLTKSLPTTWVGNPGQGFFQVLRSDQSDTVMDFNDTDESPDTTDFKMQAYTVDEMKFIVTDTMFAKDHEITQAIGGSPQILSEEMKSQHTSFSDVKQTNISSDLSIETGYFDQVYYERPEEFTVSLYFRDKTDNLHALMVEGPQDKASVEKTIALAEKIYDSFTTETPAQVSFNGDIEQ
ncbi:hypothetical protein ESZ50_07435 [Weissella muntiaci]|uniref:Uncharacterized protein n=1 Tax=Weissella muntiaci TaxID=2508881 RepID=A0A6C2C500_9LACO|nr:hypothetical protein [Weissella muntiaci]TYC49070.1 hypothetical protein ESZ50_07435 [Weissella muntiaci]